MISNNGFIKGDSTINFEVRNNILASTTLDIVMKKCDSISPSKANTFSL